MATLSQRNSNGKLIGHPSVGLVASAEEAKHRAKTLAQSLGLKVYGFIDKTKAAAGQKKPPEGFADTGDGDAGSNAADEERPPWLVPGGWPLAP